MKILHERFTHDDEASLSLLWVDGVFQAFAVEDTFREVKVPGKTRIPEGHYKVTLRDEGGMTLRYRRLFPDLHKGMLWIRDVPNFEWIYYHIGNTHEHTEGCPLVTTSADKDTGFGGGSTKAYEDFYARVVDAAAAGDLFTHIIDRDR